MAFISQVILANIPDQIGDRTKFLGIIRDIAACIKEMLDAVNHCCTVNENLLVSQKGVSLSVGVYLYVSIYIQLYKENIALSRRDDFDGGFIISIIIPAFHLTIILSLQPIEQQKKVFVRGSKSFSDTLKRYFKDGR